MDAHQVRHGKRPVKVLHLIDRFTADEDGSLILDICSVQGTDHTKFEHAIHSLHYPTAKGVSLTKEQEIEVDHGSGVPMLQYKLGQSDLVILYWKNTPILHQLLTKELAYPKLVVWNLRGGSPRGHGLPASCWPKVSKFIHPRLGDLRELLAQFAPTDRGHAGKITQLLQPDRFKASTEQSSPQEETPLRVGCPGPILKQDYQASWLDLQMAREGAERRILVGTHGDTSWIRDQVYSSPQPESCEIHPILGSDDPFLEQLHIFTLPLQASARGDYHLHLRRAMKAGLPCVVFHHPSVEGLIMDRYSGLVVHTKAAFRQALQYLCDHPEERRRLGANAKAIADQLYNEQSIVREIAELLVTVAEDQGMPEGSTQSSSSHPDRIFAGAVEQGHLLLARSLGDDGLAFRSSLRARNLQEAEEWDLEISSDPLNLYEAGLQDYLEAYPDDPWVHYWFGLCALGQCESDRASKHFIKARTLGLWNQRTQYHLGKAAVMGRQRHLLQQCVRDLAQQSASQAHLEELTQELKKMVPEDKVKAHPEGHRPDCSAGLTTLLTTIADAIQVGDHAKAFSNLLKTNTRQLLSATPTQWDCLVKYGSLLNADQWLVDTACLCMTEGIAVSSLLEAGLEAAEKLKQDRAGLCLAETLVQSDPRTPHPYQFLGRRCYDQKQFKESSQYFAKSLELIPDHLPTLEALARCFQAMNDDHAYHLTQQHILSLSSHNHQSLKPTDKNMKDPQTSHSPLPSANGKPTVHHPAPCDMTPESAIQHSDLAGLVESALNAGNHAWLRDLGRALLGQEGSDEPILLACCHGCVGVDDRQTLLDLFEAIVARFPDHPQACRIVAAHYLQHDLSLNAAGYLARSLKQDPTHESTLESLAECFAQAGEHHARELTLERLDSLRQAMKHDAQQGESTSPIQSLEPLQDEPSKTHVNGTLHSMKRENPVAATLKHPELIGWVQAALEEEDYSWLLSLGRMIIEHGDVQLEIMQSCCRACVELDEASTLMELTQRVEAVSADDPCVYRLIAAHHLNHGRSLKAAGYLARSLKRDPEDLPTLQALSECFEQAGELEAVEATRARIEAIQQQDAGLESTTDSMPGAVNPSQKTLGQNHEPNNGHETDTLGHPIRPAVESSILDHTQLVEWIQAALAEEDFAWLGHLGRAAVNHDSVSLEVLQACCRGCVEMEDLETLLRLADKVESLSTDDPEVCRFVAGYFLRKNDYIQAAPYLARSLNRDHAHIPTLSILADCFEQAGELEARDHTQERIHALEQELNQQSNGNLPIEQAIESAIPSQAQCNDPITQSEGDAEPLVSAIVSTYASERFIKGCLDDLLAQSLGDQLEIIVIDSGSPENEGAIVKDYQSRHPNIRYLRTEARETVYQAWNRGVAAARGRYVVNANTDDGHRQDCFEVLMKALDARPDASLAYGDIVYSSVANDRFPSNHITQQIHYPDYHPGLAFAVCYSGCTQFWRREDLVRVGGFDPEFKAAGDFEALLRAASLGLKAVHVPEELSLHFYNHEGITFGSDTSQVSLKEADQARNHYIHHIKIGRLYGENQLDSARKSALWSDLAHFFYHYRAPWHQDASQTRAGNLSFIAHCLKKALEEDSSNQQAASNLIWLQKQGLSELKPEPYLLSLGQAWRQDSVRQLENQCDSWKACACDFAGQTPSSVALSTSGDESQSTAMSQDRNHSQAMRTGLTPEECLVKADKEFAETRYEQSWEYAQQAILGRPFNPEAVYLMGKIALLAGDQPKVESCVEALEQMTPKWELKQLLEDELSAMQAGPLLLTLSPIRCFGSRDRLSVCMIAKNEASFIGQAIDSVQDIAHEIIVVDTGSTDETVEIARSKGAKVVETVWEDDFSQARNIYLKHATGDWILVLDADECLAAEDLPLLKEDLRKPNALCLRLPIYNHGANEYGRGFVPRLFRNAPWITYQGAIHEQIHAHIVALNQQWDTETTLGSTPIQHYGYQDHVIKAKGKRERNLMMLQKAIETREGDPNIEYNYALELRNAGKMDESLLHFRKAFELIRDLPESHQVQEFNLAVVQQLATVLFSMKDYQGVLQLTEEAFVKQLGMFASLSLLVSMASQAMGDHENTLIYAEQCIALRDQPVMIPGILDVQTGLPHILIARALINLERFEESEAAYAAALERCPDRLDYLLESCHALQKRQETLKALDLLSNQVERFGQVRDFWMAGFGFALEDAHLWPFAFDWGTEALKYFKDQRDICYAYLMAAMLNGHWNKAAAFHAEFTPHPTNAQENAVEIMLLLSQGKQPTLHPSVAEKQCSEAFMQFYRRLLTGNNGNAIRTINDHLEGMEACLPSASGLIRQALKTTQTHAVG